MLPATVVINTLNIGLATFDWCAHLQRLLYHTDSYSHILIPIDCSKHRVCVCVCARARVCVPFYIMSLKGLKLELPDLLLLLTLSQPNINTPCE